MSRSYKSTQAWNLSSVTGTAGGSRCSAGRRLPARITTSPIRPAMAVARPTLTHHCRRYPWTGLGGGQASLIHWQGVWDRKFERRSRLGGVAGSSIPAFMNWPTKIASGICSTSQMIISVEAMSTNVARELRFGGVHRNVSPKCRPIALANCPESNHYTNSVSWAVSETYGEITSQAGGSGTVN